ncbi:hypothetical protein L218DRAFT_956981 [Marasmius fiardii PR-910]|nr:hypothetical protein L218DRAFT_956981 [Marasmius fiardii PR-910]
MQIAHKRKHSSDLGSSGKSPKRGRFSSLFGLNIFEYEHGQVQQTATPTSYRVPKAPPTCTVSLETAGVLGDNTNLSVLSSPSSTESNLVSLSTPSPQPNAAVVRFRCSPSSSQSFFKGHHARSNSFLVLQDDQERIHISPSNLKKRGDVKLVAMVRKSVVAGSCVNGSQDVLLAQRLMVYLDQWGWKEREREECNVGSVFDMDVDEEVQVGMDVDGDMKPSFKPAMTSHTNHSPTLPLDQLVATLTLKHRERPSVAGRFKERDTIVSRTTKSSSCLRWELGQG